MTAFSRNRTSAESVHLSTFGAETETEAEIRSTSSWLVRSFVLLVVIFSNSTSPIFMKFGTDAQLGQSSRSEPPYSENLPIVA